MATPAYPTPPNPSVASPADLVKYQAMLGSAQNDLTAGQAAQAKGDMTSALKSYKEAMDYVVGYYSAQTYRGYAKDAQQVVQNTGVFGKVANQEIIDAVGLARYATLIPVVAVQLALADLDLLKSGNGVAPTENQISNYHYQVYAGLGIAETHWGGSAAASLGGDWAQGTLGTRGIPQEVDADLKLNKFYANFGGNDTDMAFANLMAAGVRAINRNPSLTEPSHWYDLLNGAGLGMAYTAMYDAKYGTTRMFVPTNDLMDEGDRLNGFYDAVQTSAPPARDPATLNNLGGLSTAVRQAMATASADPTDAGVTGSVTTVTLSDGRNYIGADAIQKALWSGWTVTASGTMRDAAGATYQVTVTSTKVLQQLACLDGEYAQLVASKPALAGELSEASFFALMQNPSFASLTLADGSVAANGIYLQDPKTGNLTGHGSANPTTFFDNKLGILYNGLDIPLHSTFQSWNGYSSKSDSVTWYSASAGAVTFGMLQAIDPSAGTVKIADSVTMLSALRQGAAAADPTVVKKDQGMDAVIVSLVPMIGGQATTSATASNAGKFDISADGTQTPVGWVGSGQALLVYDPYGTPVVDSTDIVRSMADLAKYDTNKDGVLSAAEADKAGVRLWYPSGGNPGTSSSVPETFAQAGVQSIAVAGSDDVGIDNGNALLGIHKVSAAGDAAASASDAYLATPTSAGTPVYYANGKAGTQQVAGLPEQEFVEKAGNYARFANNECVYDDAGGSTFCSQGLWQVDFTLGKGSTLELGNDTGDQVRLNDTGDTLRLDLVKDASGIGIRQSGNDVVISEVASHCSLTLVGLMSDAAAGWDPQGTIVFAGGGSMSTSAIVATIQRVAAAFAGSKVVTATTGARTTTAAPLVASVSPDMSALAATIGQQGHPGDTSLFAPVPVQTQASLVKAHPDA